MIKGIIKQAVIEILAEQNLIDDPYGYKSIRDTQTRVRDIENVLDIYREELNGLGAALEICYTDDEGIEKKYRHKKWCDITKEERDLLFNKYNMSFDFIIGKFIVRDADYIGDSFRSKKCWEELRKQAVENSTKKAKKNARRK